MCQDTKHQQGFGMMVLALLRTIKFANVQFVRLRVMVSGFGVWLYLVEWKLLISLDRRGHYVGRA